MKCFTIYNFCGSNELTEMDRMPLCSLLSGGHSSADASATEVSFKVAKVPQRLRILGDL